MTWVTVDQIVSTLGHPDISGRGQYQFQSRKYAYICLLNLMVKCVMVIYPFVLVMLSV